MSYRGEQLVDYVIDLVPPREGRWLEVMARLGLSVRHLGAKPGRGYESEEDARNARRQFGRFAWARLRTRPELAVYRRDFRGDGPPVITRIPCGSEP